MIDFLANHPHHIDTVLDWRYSEWARYFGFPEKRLWREKLVAQCGRETIPAILIALENDEPMGTASLVQNAMTLFTELSPWLSGVYVIADRRCQGIGGLLVARVEALARELACEKLFLFTFDQDAYYAKRGWREIRKDSYVSVPVSIMEKSLNP